MNVVLFVCKIVAAIWSGSLAVFALTIDSFLDIGSGSILYFAAKSIKKGDFHQYPEGKSRLEPLAIIMFSVVMGMASVQLITYSVQALIEGLHGSGETLRIDVVSITLLAVVVGTKTMLLVYCRALLLKCRNGTIQALAQDHLNDIVTNSLAIATIVIISFYRSYWFLDPITALVISLYILLSWVKTAKEQMGLVVGITASPQLLSQMAYIAMHHPGVIEVDTVRAYHTGQGYLSEVDIVLPENMLLRRAHDIGESLEILLERLESVQRAFIHLDYESKHAPEYQRRRKGSFDLFKPDKDQDKIQPNQIKSDKSESTKKRNGGGSNVIVDIQNNNSVQ